MSGYQTKGQLIVLHPRTGTQAAGDAAADTHATDDTLTQPLSGIKESDPAIRRAPRPDDAQIIAGPGYNGAPGLCRSTAHTQTGTPPEATAHRSGTAEQKTLTFYDLFGGTDIADAIVRTHQDVLMQAETLKK